MKQAHCNITFFTGMREFFINQDLIIALLRIVGQFQPLSQEKNLTLEA